MLRFFASLLVVSSCQILARAETAADRPNVLFIAVDDLRPSIGCYGDRHAITPNIDRLASRGLVFDRAYCQMAICMASRASLLSGHRPTYGEIYKNGPLFNHVPDALTLNQHFLDNGYQTVSMGKIYHYRSDLESGFSKPDYWPKEGQDGDNLWYGRGYMGEEGKRVAKEHDRIHKRGRQGMGPAFEAADMPGEEYIDGRIGTNAVEELGLLKEEGEPFFMAVGFIKPHLPFVCPKKYWDMYDPDELPLPKNTDIPRGAPPTALTKGGELMGYYGMPKEGPVPEELTRKLVHGYYACTTYTDSLIGDVLDELDRLELTDNTIVILWGDHGWKLGDLGMWCKHTNFEIDCRVPMILSAPGMKAAGQHTEALVELVDIYPTLCDLCGIAKPAHLQGSSMAPLLDAPSQPWKEAAFSCFYRKRANVPDPNAPGKTEVLGQSIRTDRYRYTEWRRLDTGQSIGRELYDYQSDAGETVNIVDDPANEQVIARLAEQLQRGYEFASPQPSGVPAY